MSNTLAWIPGHFELGVILIVALLIFGRRVPEMIGNLGKGCAEFRKGIKEGLAPDIEERKTNENEDK
ncbi:MAG: Sec-independent protein translocase subunit TatA/TatB [Planctomycetota bacterium]